MANVAPQSLVPRWLPNAISVVRVLLVPVWLWLAVRADAPQASGFAPSRELLVGVLVALGLSDIVDGFLARRFHLASNFGATLDAAADKLAQVATVGYLAAFAGAFFERLPLWLLVVLVVRDAVLAGGFFLIRARHREVHVAHKWHGKASSLLLFFLVLAVTAGLRGPPVPVLSAVVLALVGPSTVAYVREGWRQWKGGPGAKAS